ncbi:MAG: S-layer homology domain-containing protein [Clostridium sp.]|nr:S-layer homology domain-containing protein [Clostridium sp.]
MRNLKTRFISVGLLAIVEAIIVTGCYMPFLSLEYDKYEILDSPPTIEEGFADGLLQDFYTNIGKNPDLIEAWGKSRSTSYILSAFMGEDQKLERVDLSSQERKDIEDSANIVKLLSEYSYLDKGKQEWVLKMVPQFFTVSQEGNTESSDANDIFGADMMAEIFSEGFRSIFEQSYEILEAAKFENEFSYIFDFDNVYTLEIDGDTVESGLSELGLLDDDLFGDELLPQLIDYNHFLVPYKAFMYIKNAQQIDDWDILIDQDTDEVDMDNDLFGEIPSTDIEELVEDMKEAIDFYVDNVGKYILMDSKLLVISIPKSPEDVAKDELSLLRESDIFSMLDVTGAIWRYKEMLEALEDEDNGEKAEVVFKKDPPSAWALSEVITAAQNELTFDEILEDFTKDITREEFCMLVVNSFENIVGSKVAVPSENVFTDTDNQHILKGYDLGIVKGVSEDKFLPHATITREEMAVMLYNMLLIFDPSLGDSKYDLTFDDSDTISSWAHNAVAFCTYHDIIKGMGNNTFAPKDNGTREQGIILVSKLTTAMK